MIKEIDVQNGTYKQLGKEVGIVAAVNNDSKGSVSYYVSEREKYVSEFGQWSKKTAQTILEMGRVVFDAKQVLSKDEFKKFSSEINARSTITKYLAIGAKYEQFYQYAELLPNSWTSIYEITQLPSETFDALVATENSMANMTGAQLKLLRGKGAIDKSKTSADSIDVNDTEAAQNSSEQSEIADYTSRESDHEYAKQATSTMLERVAATACTTVDVESTTVMPTYEVVIRFNSIPTDDSWWDLTEEIESLVEKYNFDVEVVESRPSFV